MPFAPVKYYGGKFVTPTAYPVGGAFGGLGRSRGRPPRMPEEGVNSFRGDISLAPLYNYTQISIQLSRLGSDTSPNQLPVYSELTPCCSISKKSCIFAVEY